MYLHRLDYLEYVPHTTKGFFLDVTLDWNLVFLVSMALSSSLSPRGLSARNEGLWEHMTFELIISLLAVEKKEILNGSPKRYDSPMPHSTLNIET